MEKTGKKDFKVNQYFIQINMIRQAVMYRGVALVYQTKKIVLVRVILLKEIQLQVVDIIIQIIMGLPMERAI